MKSSKLTLLSLLFLASVGSAYTLPKGSRSIFLNGVDISSAKNQTMQHVNIKIDAYGNVYIEAPQYEAQQESTFVPLGRRPPLPGQIPQHKAPGPLPNRVEPQVQTEPALASPDDSGVEQAEGGAAQAESAADSGLAKKEGTRVPQDAGIKPAGAESSSGPHADQSPQR